MRGGPRKELLIMVLPTTPTAVCANITRRFLGEHARPTEKVARGKSMSLWEDSQIMLTPFRANGELNILLENLDGAMPNIVACVGGLLD